jgi:hypothetical protein
MLTEEKLQIAARLEISVLKYVDQLAQKKDISVPLSQNAKNICIFCV